VKQSIGRIYYLCCFIILSLCVAHTAAELDYPALRRMYSIFKPEKRYLSPIHGFCLCKSPIIWNLYILGKREDATVSLVRRLFHVAVGSIYPSRQDPIVSHLSPQGVGAILGIFEPLIQESGDSLPADLAKRLTDVIAESLVWPGGGGSVDGLLQFLKAEKKAKRIDYKPTKPRLDAALNSLVSSIVGAFSESLPLSAHATYPPFFFHNIMQAFLWANVQSKAEFYGYFNGLIRFTQEGASPLVFSLSQLEEQGWVRDEFGDPDREIFAKFDHISSKLEALSSDADKRLRHSEFRRASFQKYIDTHEKTHSEEGSTLHDLVYKRDKALGEIEKIGKRKQEIAGLRSDHQNEFDSRFNYEGKVAFARFHILQNQIFPESLEHSVVRYGSAGHNHPSFPDCVETALRNFLNYLLYDPVHRVYDVSLLRAAFGKALDGKLEEFYTDEIFRRPEAGATVKAHEAWAKVVSSRQGVGYRRSCGTMGREKDCELIFLPKESFARLIHHLFGVNTLADFVERINRAASAAGIEVHIEGVEDARKETGIGKLLFRVNGNVVGFNIVGNHVDFVAPRVEIPGCLFLDNACSDIAFLTKYFLIECDPQLPMQCRIDVNDTLNLCLLTSSPQKWWEQASKEISNSPDRASAVRRFFPYYRFSSKRIKNLEEARCGPRVVIVGDRSRPRGFLAHLFHEPYVPVDDNISYVRSVLRGEGLITAQPDSFYKMVCCLHDYARKNNPFFRQFVVLENDFVAFLDLYRRTCPVIYYVLFVRNLDDLKGDSPVKELFVKDFLQHFNTDNFDLQKAIGLLILLNNNGESFLERFPDYRKQTTEIMQTALGMALQHVEQCIQVVPGGAVQFILLLFRAARLEPEFAESVLRVLKRLSLVEVEFSGGRLEQLSLAIERIKELVSTATIHHYKSLLLTRGREAGM